MPRLCGTKIKLLVAFAVALLTTSGRSVLADTSQMQAYAAAMQLEESARSADNSYSWQQAAQAWLKHYPNMVQSRDERILATKRSTACSVRAYEAAQHETKAAQDNASEQLFASYHLMQGLEPANPTWHYLLGVGYTTCGDYISARQSLSEAVKMAPNSDVAKRSIAQANHNLPAVRQAQAAHDAYENSAQGQIHKQVNDSVRQGNYYAATHPRQYAAPGYQNDKYFLWKQYNSNHTPQSYDSWATNVHH